MLGSWSGIARSHRIRGWQEVRLSIKSEFAETNNLVVDFRALIRGFRTACFRAAILPKGSLTWNGSGRNRAGCFARVAERKQTFGSGPMPFDISGVALTGRAYYP